MDKKAFPIDSKYVEKVLEALPEGKYLDLVWAARKPNLDAPKEEWEQYWNEDGRPPTPEEIRMECLKQLRRVAATYPEEIKTLADPDQGNYEHGFNSGCLAMCRWVLDVFDNRLHNPEETGDLAPICFGGINKANENFPELDT